MPSKYPPIVAEANQQHDIGDQDGNPGEEHIGHEDTPRKRLVVGNPLDI